jgi:UDP-glucose 4-epimerase
MSYILVTGGAGYIGSHTVLQLLQAGFGVIVFDNLSNSSVKSLDRVRGLTKRDFIFVRGDICDDQAINKLFKSFKIDAVLHFAALKAVGESVQNPLKYYKNNVNGTLVLLEAMKKADVYKFVFSSSATVYGDPTTIPITESCQVGDVTNPYGKTKFIIEEMLKDLRDSDNRWSFGVLRYFNPIGAHPSGQLGEDSKGVPNNLVPYITQVAVGKLPYLSIFGNDYQTLDGTGVRDYIHVVDLASGHLKALDFIDNNVGLHVWNLGTGVGYSVMQLIQAFEKISGKNIRYKIISRRPGDVAVSYADNAKAIYQLNWRPNFTLEDMLKDAWNWQVKNPFGYDLD